MTTKSRPEKIIAGRQNGRRTIIEPPNTPRLGWFNTYKDEKDPDAWAGITETPAESEDWQWKSVARFIG